MLIKLLSATLTAIVLIGCETSPTGRSQLLMMSNSEMQQMGEQSFNNLKKEMPIEHDAKINAYVRCVAKAITNEVGGDWEVVVFKEPSANAFALPGRKNWRTYRVVEYCAKSGFNPEESVTLWVNMGKAGGAAPPEFMSTHPAHATRITDLQKQMPTALKLRQQAQAKGKNPQCN